MYPLTPEKKDDNDAEEDICKYNRTLNFVLVTERRRGLGFGRDLTLILNNFQEAIKRVSQMVRNYGIFRGMQMGLYKSQDKKYLIKRCEGVLIRHLRASQSICLIASCYSNELMEIQNSETGRFIATFVSIEGFSMNYGTLSGTIFSIYKKQNKDPVQKEDLLQSGCNLISAGYALYTHTTILVFAPAAGTGVMEYHLDPDTNNFILTDANVEIPLNGNIYCMNEGRSRAMSNYVLDSINKKKAMHCTRGRPLKCLFTGSIVADLHAILKGGGLLIAPPFGDHIRGLMKQQFMSNPLAFIVTEAGGAATDGVDQILHASVDEPHQKTPLYLGSIKEHQEFMKIISGMNH